MKPNNHWGHITIFRSVSNLLLALVITFGVLAFLALALAPLARVNRWDVPSPNGLALGVAALVWAGCALGAHWVVNRYLPHHDPYLLPLVYLLSGWGLALIWRLAPGFGARQTAWLVAGTAAMLVMALWPGDLRWLKRYRYTWLLLGLVLTGLTLLVGVNPSGAGAQLWLGGWLGVFLQPAEILKALLVVFLAAYLADRRDQIFQNTLPMPAYFGPLTLLWLFSVLILISQRDLGMSTLFFATFLVMLYFASGKIGYVVVGGVLLLFASVAGYALFDVVRVRVEAWWNPWADPSGRSFQIVQSLIAIAEGGVFGRGPGLGAPTLIPVAHSDFVFAALAEEWGLLGVVGSLGALMVFIGRGARIALQRPEPFHQLLAAGLTSVFAIQSLLIIGGVMKLIPLTGLALPWMSYGGTSLVTSFVMVGWLLRLSVRR